VRIKEDEYHNEFKEKDQFWSVPYMEFNFSINEIQFILCCDLGTSETKI